MRRGEPRRAERADTARCRAVAQALCGEDRRLCLLALGRAEFLRPIEKLGLLSAVDGADSLLRLSRSDLECLLGRRVRTTGWKPAELIREAEADLLALTRGLFGCTFIGDEDYPSLLGEIYDPPLLLYYRGSLPDSMRPLVGVVGTRRPTGSGRSAAYRLGMELAREGVSVVSGLARGIDKEVHRGCLSCGGRVVGVLGSGLHRIYPKGSTALARSLLERGGVLFSEYPMNTPPLKHHFPARNRIISGLSRAVVVVQAPERSGALITADYALEQGRDLLVHLVGLVGQAGRGTAELADSGARVIDRGADVLGSGRRPRQRSAHRSIAEQDPAALVALELGGKARFHNGRYVLMGGPARLGGEYGD